jgi:hypothetical protein
MEWRSAAKIAALLCVLIKELNGVEIKFSYAIVHTSFPRNNLSRSAGFFALACSIC